MASGWDGIEEFLAVYDCGRFALAAEALGLSPSHVSRAIQRLEAKLQARLFVRSTRQVTPTETGHAFALSCRKLVETRDESFRAIAAQGAPTGSLRITCPVAFGERHVAPVLRRLVEAYPQIEVALDLDNRVLDLAAHRYDLAIRTGRLSDSRLIGTRIATRRLHLAAAPAYLDRHGTPASLADLARHACLLGTAPVWRFVDAAGRRADFRPKARWRCNSGFAVADAAIAGLGLCQLPDFYVADAIAAGSLIALLDAHAVPEEPVWAVYPDRQHLQPKVRIAIDMLREALAGQAGTRDMPGSGGDRPHPD